MFFGLRHRREQALQRRLQELAAMKKDDEKPSDKQVGGDHYKNFAIQPSQFIHRNNIGWHEGNAIKRISRWKQKGGHEDLLKAIHELELLLEEEGYYNE